LEDVLISFLILQSRSVIYPTPNNKCTILIFYHCLTQGVALLIA